MFNAQDMIFSRQKRPFTGFNLKKLLSTATSYRLDRGLGKTFGNSVPKGKQQWA